MDDVRFLENKFSDEIQEHIKRALPQLYDNFIEFRSSTNYEDTKLSFDLVFNFNFTISIRIRQNKFVKFNDLTIRSRASGGGRTELDKIKDGLAQVYFYAYMDINEDSLEKVRIANVDAIRQLILKDKFKGPIPNGDGTEFIALKFKDILENNGAIYKFNKKITL
jgi:hypothetical protein